MRHAVRLSLTALGLSAALGAAPAMADNNWAFDDPYWKQQLAASPAATRSAEPFIATAYTGARESSKYDLVDNYNP